MIRRKMLATTFLLAAATLTGCATASDQQADPTTGPSPDTVTTSAGPAVTVSTAGERPSTVGAAETFTGDVAITPLLDPTETSTAGAGMVTFQPGARTAWHTHPAGQRLIVTDGTGWVQEDGAERLEIRAGDVVTIDPGVRHWHGATATEEMTHIAVQDTVDGSNADWAELVPDTIYEGR